VSRKYELQDVPFTQVIDEDEKPFTLFQLLKPRRIPILGVLIIVAFEAFCLQIGPRLVELAINNGIEKNDFGYVAGLAGLYVVLLGVATGLGAARTKWSGQIGEDLLYGLRVRVFGHIQRLSLDYFTDEKAGRIMTRVTSDVEAIQVLFQQGLVNMWLQVCTLGVIMWQLFSMNVTLACWVLGFAVPAMAIATFWFRSESDHGYLAVRDWIAGVMADLQENLSGTRVRRSQQPAAVQQRQAPQHRRRVPQSQPVHRPHRRGCTPTAPSFIGVLAQGVVLVVGGTMVLDGKLNIGEFTPPSRSTSRACSPRSSSSRSSTTRTSRAARRSRSSGSSSRRGRRCGRSRMRSTCRRSTARSASKT